MQNIPGITIEKAQEQLKTVKFSSFKQSDNQMLFADLFDQHSNRIENELALTPVSTKDAMLDTAPATVEEEEQAPLAPAMTKAPVTEDKDPEVEEARDRDQRMTQEDLDEVRDDLKEYGMTDKEIAEIEEEVNSEDGMTWGQFVATVAHKMADMRKVSFSDEQKEKLGSFFGKFGFTPKESAKLISQLENGEHAKVMTALKTKLDNMPQGQQMLFTKDEVEAFSAAMNFSKEFTSQLKEQFGKHMLPKDMKQAFTQIDQELANMDAKDEKLVRAIGKRFIAAVSDKTKETTAAKEVEAAVDLKPRVAEDGPKVSVKEDFKEAVDARKDAMPDAGARKTEQKAMPEKAQPELHDHKDAEADDPWNNFFGKLQDNSTQTGKQFQAKTENIADALRTDMTNGAAKTKSQAWEKIAAPKVMRQVEDAFIQNLGNGTKQLTLQLTPENLGKLNVVLQVQGKEVSAVIKAESPEAARLIADNIDVIKNSLESQGLKVEKLDVQTGLSSEHDFRDWHGQENHNMARDREAMVAMRQHMKQMREERAGMAQDMQNIREQAINAEQGLHVIA